MILNKFIKAHWRCSLVPKLNYPSSSANKILAKVPLRCYSRTAIKVPVQRMGLFTRYFNLCQNRKIHIVLVLHKSCNATVSQRLLISKLVTRKCHNTEVLIIKFWLEFHKLLVMLVCVATLTCNIHNQQDLTVWNNNSNSFGDNVFFKSGVGEVGVGGGGAIFLLFIGVDYSQSYGETNTKRWPWKMGGKLKYLLLLIMGWQYSFHLLLPWMYN